MTTVAWLERHQVGLYVAAIATGVVVGLLLPPVALAIEPVITPVLALLMYATFMGVPVTRIGRALADRRFLSTVLAVNVLGAPLVAVPLAMALTDRPALLIGVLVVLLAPCVDYVIVFTTLAGGAGDRLVAATPLLMLAQVVTVPLVLALAAGPAVLGLLDVGPFLTAFLLVIVVPLGVAALTQLGAARRMRPAAVLTRAASTSMVPLMMLTLAVVVASQIRRVGEDLATVVAVIPVFVLFVVVMTAVGAVAGRVAGLGAAERRAVLFSGVTRNSLVVLPVTLPLSGAFAIVPLVVVTQTLVELVAMVVLVKVVPVLVPTRR